MLMTFYFSLVKYYYCKFNISVSNNYFIVKILCHVVEHRMFQIYFLSLYIFLHNNFFIFFVFENFNISENINISSVKADNVLLEPKAHLGTNDLWG
jgi:hypothetical protein